MFSARKAKTEVVLVGTLCLGAKEKHEKVQLLQVSPSEEGRDVQASPHANVC